MEAKNWGRMIMKSPKEVICTIYTHAVSDYRSRAKPLLFTFRFRLVRSHQKESISDVHVATRTEKGDHYGAATLPTDPRIAPLRR